jgi:protein-tyrosine phosphatase
MVLMKYKKRIIASVAFFYFLFWVFYPALSAGEVLIFAAEKQSSGSHQSHEKSGPAAVLPDGARISENIYGLEGLSNVGRVSRGIYRGAQPLPEGYVMLKAMGIKTVINLRSQHSEKKEVEAAGMRSIEIPMSVFRSVDTETVTHIIDIMINPDNQPVYIHCPLGQDRTGVVIAAYRMRVEMLRMRCNRLASTISG